MRRSVFNLLLLSDAQVDELLRQFASGELAALPDGVSEHLAWLRWRDRDGPARDFDAKTARLAAVEFVAWCRAGLIPDETPKARVRDAYGLLATDLVDDWCRRYPAPAIPTDATEADSIGVQLALGLAGAAYQEHEARRKK